MLREYWKDHPETQGSLQTWEWKTKRATWKKSQDVIDDYPKASPVAEDRIYFRLGAVRLVVGIDYEAEIVFTKWVGDRRDVKKIDPATVESR